MHPVDCFGIFELLKGPRKSNATQMFSKYEALLTFNHITTYLFFKLRKKCGIQKANAVANIKFAYLMCFLSFNCVYFLARRTVNDFMDYVFLH